MSDNSPVQDDNATTDGNSTGRNAPDGKFACGLSASSGDRAIDAQLCKTAARCGKKGELAPERMLACIDARKPAILTEFAARVRAKRG